MLITNESSMPESTIIDGDIPYFAWDRRLTASEIRQQLASTGGRERARLAAWIMREARFPDVWHFLSPAEVAANLDAWSPYLGRSRQFWIYIIGLWRELGKV
jgi:hypothetical protein